MAELDSRIPSPILITGAGGFIGSHLTELCVEQGYEVRAFVHYKSNGSWGWLDASPCRSRIEVIAGDVRDHDVVARAMDGCRTALHLAALIGIPYSYAAPQSYVDVNVTGTLNLLEAARANGPQRIVTTSTSEVYGTALREPIDEDHPLQGQSPYSASKIGADMMAEAFARSFDLPVVILRPFNTYGPRQSERAVIPTTIRQALDPACAEIRLGDTETRRDFTFVGDTVEAFAHAGVATGLEPGRPYNAGTGQSVTIGAMADRVRALTGTNKPVVVDETRMRPAASEVRALLADATRFSDATGWHPATDLETGLSTTIAWWRDRLSSGAVRASADYRT